MGSRWLHSVVVEGVGGESDGLNKVLLRHSSYLEQMEFSFSSRFSDELEVE